MRGVKKMGAGRAMSLQRPLKTGAEAPVSVSELLLVKLGHSYDDVP